MTSQLPSDAHAVGDSGHTSDHNNIVDVLTTITGVSAGSSVTRQAALNGLAGAQTSGDYLRGDGTNVSMSAIQSGDLPASGVTAGSYTTADITVDSAGRVTAASNGTAGVVAADVWLSGLGLPSGALAETYPRLLINTSSSLTSGTAYATILPLPAGLTVSNIMWLCRITTTTTHAWTALTDSTGKVLAVSADTPGSAAQDPSFYTLAMGTPYTTAVAGVYYAVLCESFSTAPQFWGYQRGSGTTSAPVVWATAGTGLTTPPAVNSSLTLAAATASPLWAAVS